MPMQFEDIRPFVRFARSIGLSAANTGRLTVARDCRLLMVQSGKMQIILDNEIILFPGDCVYIPAGFPYFFPKLPQEPTKFFCINFDFTLENAEISQPLPPSTPEMQPLIFEVPSMENAHFFEQPLFFSKMHILEPVLREMEKEFLDQRLFMHSRLSALFHSLLTQLARIQFSDLPRHPDAVEAVLQWIGAHFSEPLTNHQLAQAVNYHPNYLNCLFLRHTGQTMHQYLINRRIQKALEMLLSTDLSITEIALSVGFSSLNRFTKEFTARTGNPPSRYRNKK